MSGEKLTASAHRSEAAAAARQDRERRRIPADRFSRQLRAYQQWRDELAAVLAEYQVWIEQQGLAQGEQDLRVYELIEQLHTDTLTVALVAEFSRGKTELLNAIFFSDFKQRLLPVGAGRTTMCPTELRYDEKDPPCVRLLPIETRRTALTISEYKRTPIHWTTLHLLKPGSVEELRQALLETTRTKRIHVREAQELGLYDPTKSRRSADPAPVNDMIEIPVWRHAVVNYPHPLLKQGLVVLDTPGLNALGVEPELTLGMLPKAQAVLFVLAADIGVTQSDLEVWNNHVPGPHRGRHLVVLNKIDALWDELQDEKAIAANVSRQVEETARILGVDRGQVFAVSAHKALVGRIKGDSALLEASGLATLESRLAEDLIPARHAIVRDRVVQEMSARIESSRALLESRLGDVERQLAELKELGGKNLDAIQKIVAHLRLEKQKYDKEVEGFQLTRTALTEQAGLLQGFISLKGFDELIAATRRAMQESWTTRGLQTGMATLFRGARERMHKVGEHAERIRRTVERIYDRLHTEYGLSRINPLPFSLTPYLVEFKRLEEKVEAFRTSPVTLMTEQHFVIEKFFITLVSQARRIFLECNATAKNWFRAVVSPVAQQIQQHKAAIEQRYEMLRKIHEDIDSLGERIAELEEAKRALLAQLATTEALLERLHRPLPGLDRP